ncbi:hypothetical protein CHUAL_010294 [Chamberlinius hualienensis]
MADIKVILSVDAISTSVDTDNIVIGTTGEKEKIVIDNIVALDVVAADDTTDDQRAVSDIEEGEMISKMGLCTSFETEDDKNIGGNSGNVLRRKKHRRGRSKKRKWKPYNKLTWDEKRRLSDKESSRAQRVRAERFAHGKAVAPYNTTQFLMEDHNEPGPSIGEMSNGRPLTEQQRERRESGNGLDMVDDYYSFPSDEEEFLQKEFCQVYQNIHAERLSTMNKMELIHEYMILEDRVEMLEDLLKELKSMESDSKTVQEKMHHLEERVKLLLTENEGLKSSNLKLKEAIDGYSRTPVSDCLNVQTKTSPPEEEKDQTSFQLTNSVTNSSVECNSCMPIEAADKKCPALVMDSESNNSNCDDSEVV